MFKRAAKLYKKGRYAEALECFKSLSKQTDDLAYALRHYIRFCNNVLGANHPVMTNSTSYPRG